MFSTKHEEWLKININLKLSSQTRSVDEAGLSTSACQRLKAFSEVTDRHKRRLTKPIRNNVSQEEVTFANKTMLKTSNQLDSAKDISILQKKPGKDAEIMKFCEGRIQPPKPTLSREKVWQCFSLQINQKVNILF